MFKKILLVGMYCTCALVATAQVEKGDKVLGANLSITSQTVGDFTFTQAFLVASGEIYVTDNISVGAGPLLFASFSDAADSGGVGLNLLGNYSFLTDAGVVMPYVGAQYTFLSTIDSESDEPPSFGSLGGNVGMKIFLTERTSIDAKLSYTGYIHSSLDEVPDGGNLALNIGFSIIFPN
ncbi:Outer membrane protein W [Reichenbachiella faecimaris]|uniref:Outer membrane protein W n=1 Tax=Reichenbachiella faecimaris TaxID=692418 RepID=A0A1W2GCA9_REIFA|nr:outer membrane beta-barrel protein [Reichenbachiella faecimaris]SMD33978.1 Outer membrane protein W [Reichenbachiella faecimaris]